MTDDTRNAYATVLRWRGASLSKDPALAAKQRRLLQILSADLGIDAAIEPQQAGAVDIAAAPLAHMLARTAPPAEPNEPQDSV